jgi:hypothetical protein
LTLSRRHWAITLSALLLAGLAFAGLTARAQPAEAGVRLVVPDKIAAWVFKSRSPQVAQSIFKAQGYQCLPIGIVCWIEGSYDPPRWGKGTVETGNPSYTLNARGWPGTDAPTIRTFPNGWKLVIFCQQQGPAVQGRWGRTTVWDYVGQYGDAPMFVSDGWVNTGTNGYVAGDCAATNYGG